MGFIAVIIDAIVKTLNDMLRVTKDHITLARTKVKQNENKARDRGTASDVSKRMRDKAGRDGGS